MSEIKASGRKRPTKKRVYPFLLSQSFINDAIDREVCPKYMQYKYIDGAEQDNEEEKNVMFRGRYFEWHLLGATRDNIEPVFIPNKIATKKKDNKIDTRPQAQADLDDLIIKAREICKRLGLDTSKGDKQLFIQSEDISGNIDWITRDPFHTDEDRQAIIDVKYTETAFDDRYRGWADFETKDDAKTQAVHYIILNYLKTGKYLPFYFFVFGKAGWVRIIKVKLTPEGLDVHINKVNHVREIAMKWHEDGWPARAEFNKCAACGYVSTCPARALMPGVEEFVI
jgi:hypothetical protein